MKDLIKSLIETSTERIKNPFVGTFIFSWIAFNWKSIMFLLVSDMKIQDRISYVETNYYSILNFLIFPLLLAFIYIVILPYVFVMFEFLVRKAVSARKRNLMNQKIDENSLKLQLLEKEIHLEDRKYALRRRAKDEEKLHEEQYEGSNKKR
jgi:hypothetical protein